jgi:hypothetical protein
MRFVIISPSRDPFVARKNRKFWCPENRQKPRAIAERKHNARIAHEEQFVALAFAPGSKDVSVENSKVQGFFFFKRATRPASIWSSASSHANQYGKESK